MYKKLFTSEAVSEGHPDKVCDQIADAILDECLRLDPHSRVACEVFATTDYVLIGGEITCCSVPDYEGIARKVLKEIGYTRSELGIGCDDCKIDVKVHTQSPDIAQGVDRGASENQGAGDQGIMFGFATDETENYMPLAFSIAQKLVRVASNMRKAGQFPHARPDMKSQVTIDYTNPKALRIENIVMSVQHDPEIEVEDLRRFILEKILKPVASSFGFNTDFEYFINPTGRFVIGGPAGDTGLTGRKLIVDTYGGYSRHGGGAFSGKDPSKVDRSASYYARYIAKNIVAAGLAKRCEVQLGYAIGVDHPVSIAVDTFGTSRLSGAKLLEIIDAHFDARPGKIIEGFGLTHPHFSYKDTAVYGCFGRPDLDLPWEKLDKVEALQNL